MTKPVITKRATKGSALTYEELDANFQNLDDATITVTGDTGTIANNLNDSFKIAGGTGLTSSVSGTTLTLDLDNTAVTAGSYTNVNLTVDAQGRITAASNGSSSNAFGNIVIGGTTIAADSSGDTLTLVAGSNITLTPNATTDTITIAASSTTDTFASDLITFGDVGFPTIQTASTAHEVLNIVAGLNSSTYKSSIQLDSTDSGYILIKSDISNANIQLSAGYQTGAYAGVVDCQSPVRIASRTTTQRDASANNAVNGTLVYNSSTNKLQAYVNSAWVDISSPSASTLTGTTLASSVVSSSLTSVGTLTGVTSDAVTAFIAGDAAISGVALQLPREGALRNTYNGANNNMYIDVSTGGTSHGQFQFRSSNAFTNVLTMSPTAFNVNPDAVVTAKTPSFGRLSWNAAIDTELTIDDYRFRVSNQGGNFPQIISNTGGTKNTAWTAVAALNGTSIVQTGNTGTFIANNAWSSLYTSHGLDAAGDTVTVTLQDKAQGRIYRITFMRSDNGSTTGYNIIAERLL